jgi:DNA-binding MarR family transcriptional regulator
MEKIVAVLSKLSNSLAEMEELARAESNLKELTISQMHYLEVISQLTNPNVTELATEMQLSKPTVTVALEKLLQKGFVAKVVSDEDRRSSHLHLTKKGMQINLMHEKAHTQFAELMAESLEPAELEQLTTLLEKLTKKL